MYFTYFFSDFVIYLKETRFLYTIYSPYLGHCLQVTDKFRKTKLDTLSIFKMTLPCPCTCLNTKQRPQRILL